VLRAAGITALIATIACGRGGTKVEAPPAPVEAAQPPTSSGPTIRCPARGPFKPDLGYFSQFYEDYILSYVFSDLHKGVYVDVGANDPDVSSVTKYFYLSGWRGINVEPIPELVSKLQRSRPEDVNLGIGISDKAGSLTFYQAQHSGLSTFDPAVMKRHRATGIAFQRLKIPVRTLTSVLDEHSDLVSRGIAFLNADVEGFERRVFSGLDFARYQPHVIMAESTAPLTEIPTEDSWEPLLSSAGYVFAMDDGLNRYYAHGSQPHLLPRFLEVNYCVGLDKVSKRIKLDGFKTLQ